VPTSGLAGRVPATGLLGRPATGRSGRLGLAPGGRGRLTAGRVVGLVGRVAGLADGLVGRVAGLPGRVDGRVDGFAGRVAGRDGRVAGLALRFGLDRALAPLFRPPPPRPFIPPPMGLRACALPSWLSNRST